MKLSVIVPVYNEAHRLEVNIGIILDYLAQQSYAYELILVNDGSKDDTENIILTKALFKKCKVVSYTQNCGKGHAIAQGVKVSSGEIVLFLDADLATPVSEIPKLLTHAQDFDCVIGSRALASSHITKKQKWYRVILGKLGNKLLQTVLIPGIQDSQCGFKLFNGEIARNIFKYQTIARWGFDFEILYLIRKYGFSIKEVAIKWEDKSHSKITLSAYAQTLFELCRIKWNNWRGKYPRKIKIN